VFAEGVVKSVCCYFVAVREWNRDRGGCCKLSCKTVAPFVSWLVFGKVSRARVR